MSLTADNNDGMLIVNDHLPTGQNEAKRENSGDNFVVAGRKYEEVDFDGNEPFESVR